MDYETKICYRCKEPILLKLFSKNKAAKDGLQRQCKKCHSELSKKYYNGNKAKHVALVKINSAKYAEVNQKWIVSFLKEHSCAGCGETDIIVLDFDHLKDKSRNISQMVNKFSLQSLQREVSKCQVLCANCHRRKTAKDQDWYKLRFG